ncbi:MAG: gliding motility-associated ABC transporter ATP-binding subunit GldA [Bacteroidetes bacterium GWE2_29_8]|nr:MAG: gliding motility-associated ABC transporter ATP-binding subunit GldA [Bacteroidetes bacterium GWE2_29_8]OFY18993.1 MAG: gliding motility-associated ABC transporter ATP-binding subunit GldA [Bacteroidetes bacterium GWF2_29_10]
MSLIFENIYKSYNSIKAVDNISFEIKKGEIVGFLGPNGAGKSTTLKMATSFIHPDKGNIYINNINVKENPSKIKKIIGYLPENNPLYYEMTVIEYLIFIAKLQDLQKNKLNSRIEYVIDVCGLEKEKNKKISELSKGYKQRVGIAHAIVHDPKILILDEPTTGLDPNQIIDIRNLIKELGKEKTIIFSSHILQEVEAIAERVIIINKGKIIADGNTANLNEEVIKEKTIKLILENDFNKDILNELRDNSFINSINYNDINKEYIIKCNDSVNARRDIFNTCKKYNFIIMELTPIDNKLEDIFINLTKNE